VCDGFRAVPTERSLDVRRRAERTATATRLDARAAPGRDRLRAQQRAHRSRARAAGIAKLG
jgi:hypothetical protein